MNTSIVENIQNVWGERRVDVEQNQGHVGHEQATQSWWTHGLSGEKWGWRDCVVEEDSMMVFLEITLWSPCLQQI